MGCRGYDSTFGRGVLGFCLGPVVPGENRKATRGHNGIRGVDGERVDRGVWGAAPRPGRGKLPLHPRHVLRTCLTGTHQATSGDAIGPINRVQGKRRGTVKAPKGAMAWKSQGRRDQRERWSPQGFHVNLSSRKDFPRAPWFGAGGGVGRVLVEG